MGSYRQGELSMASFIVCAGAGLAITIGGIYYFHKMEAIFADLI